MLEKIQRRCRFQLLESGNFSDPNGLRFATAVVLVAAALSDKSFSVNEHQFLASTCSDILRLPSNVFADLWVEGSIESSQESFLEGVSNLCAQFSADARAVVLTLAWTVLLSDGVVQPAEEQFAEELARLLGMNSIAILDAKQSAQSLVHGNKRDFQQIIAEAFEQLDRSC